jgi:hypothetical protein
MYANFLEPYISIEGNFIPGVSSATVSKGCRLVQSLTLELALNNGFEELDLTKSFDIQKIEIRASESDHTFSFRWNGVITYAQHESQKVAYLKIFHHPIPKFFWGQVMLSVQCPRCKK